MQASVKRVSLGLSVIVVMAALYTLAMSLGQPIDPALASAGSIEVWWPSPDAELSGVQPFKAVLSETDLADYEMFWQVDGGVLNPMVDSHVDHPHKEAAVDLSEWSWNGAGPYELTFVASRDGKVLARRSLSVRIGSGDAPQPSTPEVAVWWPGDGARLSGVQPLKAVVEGMALADYEMFWQVDGGVLNPMVDSHVDHPHKEAAVDLSEWSWNGAGPYQLTFVASADGATIATGSVSIYVGADDSLVSTTTTPSTTISTSTTLATTTTSTTTADVTAGLAGSRLYVAPWSPAGEQADAWREERPHEAALLDRLASQPTARWFGDWNSDISREVAETTDVISAAGGMPVYVAYNIPQRDCSGYSGGGAGSAKAYRSWIASFAGGIGDRAAVVVLEPDALALLDCLSDSGRRERINLIKGAVDELTTASGALVYLDAGHARWHSPAEMARRLRSVGVERAAGFALNVSNFVGTEETVVYGQAVAQLLGGKPFVVDTSRNGLGPSPDGEWCNPSGRAVGPRPSTSTGISGVDAYLWIKVPGESDGSCNGGPVAGAFWPEYAVGLAERADW